MAGEKERLGEGKFPTPSCQVVWGNSPEVEWAIIFPGHRAEEALRPPTGRGEGEVSRFSVAPSGKSGEVGREDFPARRVIGPVRGPRGGGGMWLRRPDVWECGLWRRGLRVSSKSDIVKMWCGLDWMAPKKMNAKEAELINAKIIVCS